MDQAHPENDPQAALSAVLNEIECHERRLGLTPQPNCTRPNQRLDRVIDTLLMQREAAQLRCAAAVLTADVARHAAEKAPPTPTPKPLSKPRLASSLRFVSEPTSQTHRRTDGAQALPVVLPPEQYKRLETLATKSGVSVARWVDSVLAHAMANDERHWEELEQREALVAEYASDRERFARISRAHLASLSRPVFDLLVEQLVTARIKGRTEGRRAAAGVELAGIEGDT